MISRPIAATVVLYLLGGCVSPSPKAPEQPVERAARAVKETRRALLALPIGDGNQTDVSPAAKSVILEMKDRLDNLIRAYMDRASPDVAADVVGRDISSLAEAFSLEAGRSYGPNELPKEAGNYGYQLSFKVQSTHENPRLIAVVPEFQIECGGDAMLLVFEHQKTGWKEVLRWQSKPYDTVGGAFGSFDYAIAPQTTDSQWYVLTKTVAPWCSSSWSAIDYSVLRPQAGTVAPKLVFAGTDGIWWGSEDFGNLEASDRDFLVTFHSASIDAGVHNRLWVRHFAIDGDLVRRIPPVAESPRDFVDEWIVSSWPDSASWTVPGERKSLEELHKKLNKIGSMGFEYMSMRSCFGGKRYQVEIAPQDDEGQRYYFSVTADGPYQLLDVSRRRARSCHGKDLLEEG